MNGIVKQIVQRLLEQFNRDRKRFLLMILVPGLFVFTVVLYQVAVIIPHARSPLPQASEFDLMKFINGYQNQQQEFAVEDLRFGEKFLHFTINLPQKPKTEFFIRQMAMELCQGLTVEYPALEEIKIKVIRQTAAGSLSIYGKAVYDRRAGRTEWEFQ